MSASGDTEGSGPAGTERTGQILGDKYRLSRLIGEGGMGAVYEAQHLVVKRRFAVKLLRPELAKSEDILVRFRREAEAAGALESEHIAAVVDFGAAADGAPYLVMEYLVGESVGSLLAREGPLPVPRAVGIVLQVCRGLEVAHAAEIVHRDLKPDNLFVLRRTDGSDLVKILDFGIAKLQGATGSGNVTRTGSALGTPYYMAPEQARGDKAIGRQADVYALGVILYELLSAEKPHPGDSYNAILAHILTSPPTPLSAVRRGLPEGLVKVVHRALDFDSKERPQTASELGRELVPFAGREVTPVHSQLELRVAVPGAPTFATPDDGESASSRRKPPASTGGRRRAGRVLLFLVPALVAGAALAAWSVRKQAPDEALSGASQARIAEPTGPQTVAPVSERASSSPVVVPMAVAPPSSASSAGVVTFGSSAERSGERPRARVPSREAAPVASTPKSAVSVNSSVSAAAAAVRSGARGATFDPKNPYQ